VLSFFFPFLFFSPGAGRDTPFFLLLKGLMAVNVPSPLFTVPFFFFRIGGMKGVLLFFFLSPQSVLIAHFLFHPYVSQGIGSR